MKSGKCPKCGSDAVRAARGGFGWGARESVYVQTEMVVTATEVDNYLCTSCGYFEHYIADHGKLAEVAQRWAPVAPSGDSTDPG